METSRQMAGQNNYDPGPGPPSAGNICFSNGRSTSRASNNGTDENHVFNKKSHNHLWDGFRPLATDLLHEQMKNNGFEEDFGTEQNASSMFVALLRQLQNGGFQQQMTADDIRQMLVKHVKQTKGIIKHVRPNGGTEEIDLNKMLEEGLDKYLGGMSQSDEYGDHFMLLAAAECFQRTILILKGSTASDTEVNPIIINGGRTADQNQTVYLGAHLHGLYKSLKLTNQDVIIGITHDITSQRDIGKEFLNFPEATCYFWPENLLSTSPLEDANFNSSLFLRGLLASLVNESPNTFLLDYLLMRLPKEITRRNLVHPDTNYDINSLIQTVNSLYGKDTVKLITLQESPDLILCLNQTLDPTGLIRHKVKDSHFMLIQDQAELSKQISGENRLDPEDRYLLQEAALNLRIERSHPEPFYKGCQPKLGDVLLERARNILCKGKPLDACFDDLHVQIYTTNINMLENQTRQRIQETDSEFFSKEVYQDQKVLQKLSFDSVKKYNLNSIDVLPQAQRLQKEAEMNPKKLFLIIADEAHWGITGKKKKKKKKAPQKDLTLEEKEEAEEEEEAEQSEQRISSAYHYLVNSWSSYKNALILQVTATPYNLLTSNTRLDLDAFLEDPVPGSEAVYSSRLLHHVKWTEGFEFYLEKGLVLMLYCMLPKNNCFLQCDTGHTETGQTAMYPWKMLLDQPENMPIQEYLFEGTLEGMTIKTVDRNFSLAVHRGSKKVGFLESGRLTDDYIYQFCLDLSYGEDALCIFTKDFQFQLELTEHRMTIETRAYRGMDRGLFKDPFAHPPERKNIFMVKRKRSFQQTHYGKQYVSLNALVASSGEEQEYSRFLRSDKMFLNLTRRVRSKSTNTRAETDGLVLGTEYCYQILLIYPLRQAELAANTFEDMVRDLSHALGDYTRTTEDLVNKLKEEINSSPRQTEMIPTAVISTTIQCVGEVYIAKAKEHLTNYMKIKNADHWDPNDIENELNLLCFLLDCCLFAREDQLNELSAYYKEQRWAEREIKDGFLNKAFSEFKETFKSKYKPFRVQENETCRAIEDLAMKENTNVLDGRMKILRIKGGQDKKTLANKIFSTLCLARRLATPESYSFEILRDYGKFKISDYPNAPREEYEKTAGFRIRKLFQQRECEELNPRTYRKCLCKISDSRRDDLKCKSCHHLHKKVETYEDLEKLPVLLIVVNKGRMGDTFPLTFNFMDMRLTSDVKYLSTLIQELGRLCRYTDTAKKGSIPYALLNEKVEKMVSNARLKWGIYHAMSIYPGIKRDHYISKNNTATQESMDYKNTSKDKNKLLFEAETQIGKTGVYLNFASKLRKMLKDRPTDEVEEEVDPDSDDDEEAESSLPDNALKQNWLRPYWSKMKKAASLPTKIDSGKYVRMYGPYVYGTAPMYCSKPPRERKKTSQKAKPKNEASVYRTHRKSHWDRCTQCKEGTESYFRSYKKDFMGNAVQVSIPRIQRMMPLMEMLCPEMVNSARDTREIPTLRTLIFMPSHQRQESGFLNLKHTMVDKEGNEAQYVQILVVQAAEFDQYVRTWGGSHAVISLPETIVDQGDVTSATGGIGYARLFIQKLAHELDLAAVFMLDDNILYGREVRFTTRQGNQEVVERDENNHLCHVPTPLFCILSDLEGQVYDKAKRAPLERFVPHCEVEDTESQESYTGPWSSYGIIGVLKNRATTVCVKEPFRRTHVHSLILMNVKALAEKNVWYKAWNLWEDLDMNNQADTNGLFVVKYNRWNISKANITDWHRTIYYWNEDTLLSQPTRNVNDPLSECPKILNTFIRRCFAIRKIISDSDVQSNREENKGLILAVDNIVERDAAPYLLIVKGTANYARFTKEDKMFIYSHLRQCKNLLLLLPASAEGDEPYELKTKDSLVSCFTGEDTTWPCKIPSDSEFTIITSGNVSAVSVSLILVKIDTPGSPVEKKMLRKRRGPSLNHNGAKHPKKTN